MHDIGTWLQNLYDSLPNQNYGWWLTTRDHQDVATLVTAVQFFYGRFGLTLGSLSDQDYDDLQIALGRNVPGSGAKSVLNRHLLLNMWRPLGLIERQKIGRINPFRLTYDGFEVARSSEPRILFESILREIRFVDPNRTKRGVASAYRGISVRPHRVLSELLDNLDGYIDREEYRLFAARMQSDNQSAINTAIQLIRNFRSCPEKERTAYSALEKSVFAEPKPYRNWVDMDLHTFSLFSLGTKFARHDTALVLAGTNVDAASANVFVFPQNTRVAIPLMPRSVETREHRQVALRIPSDDKHDTPPAPNIQANSGREAEGFVRRMLEANEFEVRDFSRFRGFGFDLWARHIATRVVYYCEVKSSTSELSNIQFTRLEVEAAETYRDHYIVFCVEHFDFTQHAGDIWTIQDPWDGLPSIASPSTTISYNAPRSEWTVVADKL